MGSASRNYISKHKRLRAYAETDFDLLVAQLSVASAVLLTPNTLTETSNLVDHIGEPAHAVISIGPWSRCYRCLSRKNGTLPASRPCRFQHSLVSA